MDYLTQFANDYPQLLAYTQHFADWSAEASGSFSEVLPFIYTEVSSVFDAVLPSVLTEFRTGIAVIVGVGLLVLGSTAYRFLEILLAVVAGFNAGLYLTDSVIRFDDAMQEAGFIGLCVTVAVMVIIMSRKHSVRILGAYLFAYLASAALQSSWNPTDLVENGIPLAASVLGGLVFPYVENALLALTTSAVGAVLVGWAGQFSVSIVLALAVLGSLSQIARRWVK